MRDAMLGAGERLIRLTHNLAALLMAVALGLVFLQVVTRFVLGDSWAWTEVVARAVVIWMVFLVAGAGFRLAAMIPLEVLRAALPQAADRWIGWAVTLCVLLFLGVLVFYGTKLSVSVSRQSVAMLDISRSWLYAAIPVGAALAIPGVLLAQFRPVAARLEDGE